ncbi:MAG TPA: phospho-N-acetylmuramoyl-pentapeptide-transferase, partial [Desulfomonilia bacterium]|nr:phospho-N-acetylmuramoyl-pentapeptide-transferase [Desulfomonilia bacterium]
MFYYLLYPLHTTFIAFNVFKYITFRTIYATITALLITLLLGPWFMEKMSSLRLKERINGYTPDTHKGKSGTPTMGGLLIACAIVFSTLMWADPFNVYVWLVTAILVTYAGLGFIDDYVKTVKGNMRGLPGRLRLLVEFAVAAAVGLALMTTPGFDDSVTIPVFKRFSLDL